MERVDFHALAGTIEVGWDGERVKLLRLRKATPWITRDRRGMLRCQRCRWELEPAAAASSSLLIEMELGFRETHQGAHDGGRRRHAEAG